MISFACMITQGRHTTVRRALLSYPAPIHSREPSRRQPRRTAHLPIWYRTPFSPLSIMPASRARERHTFLCCQKEPHNFAMHTVSVVYRTNVQSQNFGSCASMVPPRGERLCTDCARGRRWLSSRGVEASLMRPRFKSGAHDPDTTKMTCLSPHFGATRLSRRRLKRSRHRNAS